ncbi:hypothetical protein H0H93_012680 [Arthromyces matolae]|nr:hypothetical protein H0H93_012680 [Arthromyces matolae]
MDFNRNILGVAMAGSVLAAGFVAVVASYYQSKKNPRSSAQAVQAPRPRIPFFNPAATGGRLSARVPDSELRPFLPVAPAVPQLELDGYTMGCWEFDAQTTSYGLSLTEVTSELVYDEEIKNGETLSYLPFRRREFAVDAILDTQFRSWENLCLFAREMDGFNKRDGVEAWCRTVSITLPLDGIDMRTERHDTVDLTPRSLKLYPENLKTLSWKGHRNQLPFFFKDKFQHLTRLSLRCELSAFDFVDILRMGQRTLESVEVRTIVEHHEPTLQQTGDLDERMPYVMEALRSLTVVSKVDFHKVVSLFKFRALEEISIVSGSTTTFNLDFFAQFDTADFERIKRLDARCFVGEAERKFLEKYISGVTVEDGPLDESDLSIKN